MLRVEQVFARQLPVGRAGHARRLGQAAQCAEIGPRTGNLPECLVQRPRRRAERDEHQSTPLLHRQRIQALRGTIQRRVALGLGDGHQRAAVVVGPAVVRAAQPRVDAEGKAGRAIAVDQACAAMAANVAECAQFAAAGTQHDGRATGAVEARSRAGRRQVRDVADELPAAGEDLLELERRAGGIEIPACRQSQHGPIACRSMRRQALRPRPGSARGGRCHPSSTRQAAGSRPGAHLPGTRRVRHSAQAPARRRPSRR